MTLSWQACRAIPAGRRGRRGPVGAAGGNDAARSANGWCIRRIRPSPRRGPASRRPGGPLTKPFAIVSLLFTLVLCTCLPASAQDPNATAEAAGLTFRTLTSQELDAIQQATKYRLGVQIVKVRPGTPGAAAGFHGGDFVFGVGKTGVDSAERAAAAIRGSSGTVDLPSLVCVEGKFRPEVVKLQLGAADPVNAYFDMMDFMRTEAFGIRFSTPEAERQRLAAMGGQMAAIPQAWAQLHLNPPAPPRASSSGGSTSGSWQAAWSPVDVAITKNIWAK